MTIHDSAIANPMVEQFGHDSQKKELCGMDPPDDRQIHPMVRFLQLAPVRQHAVFEMPSVVLGSDR
jgi:hypothetical protein